MFLPLPIVERKAWGSKSSFGLAIVVSFTKSVPNLKKLSLRIMRERDEPRLVSSAHKRMISEENSFARAGNAPDPRDSTPRSHCPASLVGTNPSGSGLESVTFLPNNRRTTEAAKIREK
jgi:hypothetical protein